MNKIKKSGVALAEALVAVGTLATAAIILSGIFSNAYLANTTSRDFLIAHNLVTEAVEAVQVIRNTNWLLRPNEKNCWLVLQPSRLRTQNTNCQTLESVIESNNYTVNFQNGLFELSTVPGTSNLDLNNANSTSNRFFMLYLENVVVGTLNFTRYSTNTQATTPTEFYRSVRFIERKADNSSATFEVKVQWQRRGVKTISKTVTIYNYL